MNNSFTQYLLCKIEIILNLNNQLVDLSSKKTWTHLHVIYTQLFTYLLTFSFI